MSCFAVAKTGMGTYLYTTSIKIQLNSQYVTQHCVTKFIIANVGFWSHFVVQLKSNISAGLNNLSWTNFS